MNEPPMTPLSGPLSRPQVVSWRNAIFVVFLLPGLAFASWASRLPAVRDALDVGVDQVGLLIFGFAVGSIAGLVLSGHIVARLGAKTTIMWGLVITSSGLMLAGVGATVGPVFAVAFGGLMVFGFASGIIDVAMNVSGAANERVLGRAIMPIFHAFFSFGTMLGAGLGALAEHAAVPIAVHLGLVAAIVVIGMLFITRHIQSEHTVEDGAEPVSTDDHSQTWRGRLSIWRDPRTLLIGVLVLSAGFAEGSASDWLALAMVDGHGVDNARGAVVFGIFVTAMTVGRLGGVLLIDRFGRVPVLRVSFLLAAAGLFAIIFIPDPVVATIGAIAWGLGAALGFPIGMSAAAGDPRTAAARVSAVATIGYFALLAGPPAIGFLGEHVGLLNALILVLVLCAVGALVANAARETKKGDASTDTPANPIDAPR
ncbi:MFS transporter [Actinoplanes sp. NBRC 103695]|uniref:MFS transporter n=1 Tax=Actinoplanes sp. NBRC 103695 TaxID=3032202 RepID=UPI0024A282A8|nr:MFS transporter [Actinoplanes sp. NBRC 103695]GLZ02057.1 MFS transporter [Actinoplanes sp. NBRC 103695]